MQAGAVPAIIALSVGEGVQVTSQRRCAAALCNLACAPANIARMVEVFIKCGVSDFVPRLRDNREVFACAKSVRLATFPSCADLWAGCLLFVSRKINTREEQSLG